MRDIKAYKKRHYRLNKSKYIERAKIASKKRYLENKEVLNKKHLRKYYFKKLSLLLGLSEDCLNNDNIYNYMSDIVKMIKNKKASDDIIKYM